MLQRYASPGEFGIVAGRVIPSFLHLCVSGELGSQVDLRLMRAICIRFSGVVIPLLHHGDSQFRLTLWRGESKSAVALT